MWLVSSFNGYDGLEKEFLVISNYFCNHLWRQLIRSAFKSNHCAIPPPMIPWELIGCLLSTGCSSLFSDWSSLFQDTFVFQMKIERRRRRLNRASGIQTRPAWIKHCDCTSCATSVALAILLEPRALRNWIYYLYHPTDPLFVQIMHEYLWGKWWKAETVSRFLQ